MQFQLIVLVCGTHLTRTKYERFSCSLRMQHQKWSPELVCSYTPCVSLHPCTVSVDQFPTCTSTTTITTTCTNYKWSKNFDSTPHHSRHIFHQGEFNVTSAIWEHSSRREQWHCHATTEEWTFCSLESQSFSMSRKLPKLPLPWGHLDFHLTHQLLEPPKIHNPNGISIGSAIFAGTPVWPTNTYANHTTSSVATGLIITMIIILLDFFLLVIAACSYYTELHEQQMIRTIKYNMN